MFKLLVIVFTIKLYARDDIFKYNRTLDVIRSLTAGNED